MFYKLDENKNVLPCSMDEYVEQFRDHENHRRVGLDEVHGTTISTVFLCLDHSHGGTPLFFETMTFSKHASGKDQRRYSTWDEAVAGHAQMVEEVRRRHALSAPTDGILDAPNGGVPS